MGNLKYGKFDVETALEEKEDLENSGGTEMMKLTVGRNVVRVLPPPIGQRSPFKTVYQHFIELPGNKKSYICARLESKKPCAICKKIDELKASPSKADRDAADDMYARRRVFVNVLNRKDPEKGPMVLAIGKQVHEQMLDLRDEDTGAGADYCDPESGFDIVIERTGTGKNDTKYKVQMHRKPSPLAGTIDDPDYDKMQELIDTQNDLTKFARLPDEGEIAQLFGPAEEEAAPALPAARTRRAAAAPAVANVAAKAGATTKARRRASAEDDAIDTEGEEVG